MTDIAVVASDNRVTARERRRQSEYRERVLGLGPGAQRSGAPLGSRLRDEHWRHNFLSPAAADYAELRAEVVSREGGQLEKSRLRTNMLSSMPLFFSIFGHLRAYPQAGAQVLGRLLGVEIVGFETGPTGRGLPSLRWSSAAGRCPPGWCSPATTSWPTPRRAWRGWASGRGRSGGATWGCEGRPESRVSGLDDSAIIQVTTVYSARTEAGRLVHELHGRVLAPRPRTAVPSP